MTASSVHAYAIHMSTIRLKVMLLWCVNSYVVIVSFVQLLVQRFNFVVVHGRYSLYTHTNMHIEYYVHTDICMYCTDLLVCSHTLHKSHFSCKCQLVLPICM